MICITVVIVSLVSSECVSGNETSYNDKILPYILTPHISKGQADLARNLCLNDPAIFSDFENIESYSGFITANETANWNLFFWYFPNKKKQVEQTPWIVWLQGGPGMTSLYGLFREIGPIQIVNGKAEEMPVTWASDYSLLFVDNPVGSGFSFTGSGKYPNSQEEIGENLLNFMKQFIQVFPELKNAPLFIAGEEYGGKHVIAMAHYIHNDGFPINMKGFIIGDGWFDPPSLLHYSEWALEQGFVDKNEAALIREAETIAKERLNEGNVYHYSGNAKNAYNLLKTFAPFNDQNYLSDYTENWKRIIVTFLNQRKIRKILHVGEVNFDFINYNVQTKIYNEIYLSVKPWLEELLEHYGVLCYSGQLDMLLAYASLAKTYRHLQWSGQKDYINARREPIFAADNTLRGYVKAAGNFMEVMVRGAGQHVPADKPKVAKQIVDLFIQKNI